MLKTIGQLFSILGQQIYIEAICIKHFFEYQKRFYRLKRRVILNRYSIKTQPKINDLINKIIGKFELFSHAG